MTSTLKLKRGTVYVANGQEELATAAAEEFAKITRDAVSARGRATIALSGGSTPPVLYRQLLKEPFRSQLPWDKMYFFVSDERSVPESSEDSNFGNARRLFLSPLQLNAEQLFPLQYQDSDPARAAKDYETRIKSLFGTAEGQIPRFDLILLGMGPDGHCASLFPGSPALQEKQRLVVENPVEKLSTTRITFTYPLLNSAANVVFLLEGEKKSEVFAEAVESADVQYPVQNVCPQSGNLMWFVDRGAAQDLCSLPR